MKKTLSTLALALAALLALSACMMTDAPSTDSLNRKKVILLRGDGWAYQRPVYYTQPGMVETYEDRGQHPWRHRHHGWRHRHHHMKDGAMKSDGMMSDKKSDDAKKDEMKKDKMKKEEMKKEDKSDKDSNKKSD